MNCYYSNLIEGHNTHPRDIERALRADFSKDLKKRNLQLEAKAHIEVQRLVEERIEASSPYTEEFLCWVHKVFCERLPEELLWIENPRTGERRKVVPGMLRDCDVQVGIHVPPSFDKVQRYLLIYREAYETAKLSNLDRIIGVSAAHHRLLWIHPFLDGNGRVTRFSSHAALLKLNAGSSLWSISRGLGRNVEEYKSFLMKADEPRRTDTDGRGSLSQQALVEFCTFFLSMCIDQVKFMEALIQPERFLVRLNRYCEEAILLRGSFNLLKHAYLLGPFERGAASEISGLSERSARRVVSDLIKRNILKSETPKGAVRINFPVEMLEVCFPKVYPALD